MWQTLFKNGHQKVEYKKRNSYKMSSHGYFSKNGSAYIVTEPYTQKPFTNVLYNSDGYLAEINQWGTGSTSVQFPDNEICTVFSEGGKALFLRNENTGKVWCPGAEPMHSAVENFKCEHGDGYSIVSSSYEQILASIRTFVPHRGLCEVWTIEVTNETDKEVKISIVPMVKLEMYGFSAPRFCDGPSQSYVTCFDEKLNGIYYEGRNPYAKDKPYDAVLLALKRVDYFSCDRRVTLAAPQCLSYPHRLLSGSNLDCTTDMNYLPFMALQCVVSLKPGETQRTDFVLGTCSCKEEAKKIVSMFASEDTVDREFNNVLSKIAERRNKIMINTPDEKMNYFINTWLKKGMEYCLRKKDATRDNLQFALGLTMSDPKATRDTLELAMHYQYKDGHTVRSWKPLDETYYSDGPIWIILVACDYLKYSDDVGFLNVTLPYFDGGEAAVLEHLHKGIQRLHEDRGPHNICLARWADWNDALNLPDKNAESVFVSMGFAWCLKEMAQLLEYIGDNMKAIEYRTWYEEIKKTINETCWDQEGEYYVRGFSEGEVIGGSHSEGSTIYANPQTWAVLSGVVTEDRIEKIVAATERYLETDLGCLVNYPAYTKYSHKFGRISYQVPGTIENGAVYCHVTAFKINADIERGDGNGAYRDLKRIIPDGEQNPAIDSGAVPYTLTSSYATNPAIFGKAGRPWLTGSQGWVMRCVVEGLLGVKKAYGGFIINPAFPDAWTEAQCAVQRKNTMYHIVIKRTGVSSIMVDGEVANKNYIPFLDKEEVNVLVTL